MKCPVCKIDLVMSERSGVEIDYCPECRGVWLDRGELDKIIDRSSQNTEAFMSDSRDNRSNNEYHMQNSSRSVDLSYHNQRIDGQNKKKCESFLGDLFDF